MGLLEGGLHLLDESGMRGSKIVALTDVRGDIVDLDRPPAASHALVVTHANSLGVAALVKLPVEIGVLFLFFSEQRLYEGDTIGSGGGRGAG